MRLCSDVMAVSGVLGRPVAAKAGSRLDETGRRQRRAAARQSVGQQAEDLARELVAVVSYNNTKQLVLESICKGDGQRSESEEGAGKHCGFPEAPDLLIPTRQRASGLRYPFKTQLELASRDLGTTAFAAAQVGENCGSRPLQWRVGHQPVLVPTKTPLQASLDDSTFRSPVSCTRRSFAALKSTVVHQSKRFSRD